MSIRSLRSLLQAVVWTVCAVAGGRAAAQAMDERDLRVAYVFNFIRFAEWPKSAFPAPDSPIHLCVFEAGASAGAALAPLQGKAVGSRTIQVTTAAQVATAHDCHVVYVADSALVRLPSLRDKLTDAPALLVGESDAALDRGAMIGFRSSERRLGFIVNLAATRRAGLRLPPPLLKIAVEVRE